MQAACYVLVPPMHSLRHGVVVRHLRTTVPYFDTFRQQEAGQTPGRYVHLRLRENITTINREAMLHFQQCPTKC